MLVLPFFFIFGTSYNTLLFHIQTATNPFKICRFELHYFDKVVLWTCYRSRKESATYLIS